MTKESGNKRKRDEEVIEVINTNEDINSYEYIDRVVRDIYESNILKKEKKAFFKRKYDKFAEKFPTLFEMSLKDDFDLNRFQYMMNLKKSVEANNISQHDASVKVGKVLYDDYVKDKIDKINK
jgi:hypothetical protein